MKPILTYKELKKYFTIGHKDVMKKEPITVKAVDGISFEVLEGEAFGLVGESGSGKSTVAYTTIGMYTPTAAKNSSTKRQPVGKDSRTAGNG